MECLYNACIVFGLFCLLSFLSVFLFSSILYRDISPHLFLLSFLFITGKLGFVAFLFQHGLPHNICNTFMHGLFTILPHLLGQKTKKKEDRLKIKTIIQNPKARSCGEDGLLQFVTISVPLTIAISSTSIRYLRENIKAFYI